MPAKPRVSIFEKMFFVPLFKEFSNFDTQNLMKKTDKHLSHLPNIFDLQHLVSGGIFAKRVAEKSPRKTFGNYESFLRNRSARFIIDNTLQS